MQLQGPPDSLPGEEQSPRTEAGSPDPERVGQEVWGLWHRGRGSGCPLVHTACTARCISAQTGLVAARTPRWSVLGSEVPLHHFTSTAGPFPWTRYSTQFLPWHVGLEVQARGDGGPPGAWHQHRILV